MYTMYIKDLQRMYLHHQFIYRCIPHIIEIVDMMMMMMMMMMMIKMMMMKMTHNGLIIIILHTLNLIYISNRFFYLQIIIIVITITITITTIHDNKNSY